MDCLTFPQVMSFSLGEKNEKVVHFSGGAGRTRQRPLQLDRELHRAVVGTKDLGED